MLSPQRPQKRAFWASGLEHLGQGYVPTAAVTGAKLPLPQRPQKRTPSAKRVWQLVQATTPGMTLDWGEPPLLPWDEDGWLEPPSGGRSCAWMTCSLAPSRISMTRSSSRSPALDTRKM